MENQNKIKILLSQTNWKAILFFTSFTSLLWLILQFTKTHNVDYEIDVEFSEVPVKEILSTKQIKLSTNIQQTGFSLLKKQFSKNKLVLPISSLEKKDSSYVFQTNLYSTEIAKKLKLPIEDFTIKNQKFTIPYSEKSTKKVPIHLDAEINYAKSYASYKGIQIENDSVEIAGPLDEISVINKIETEALLLQDIKNSQSGNLAFKTPFSKAIAVQFNEISYTIEVEKFTEQTLSLPIQLINSPQNFEVELIPETITLKFQSSLEEMQNIDEGDFVVICDFNSALSEASLIIPRIKKQPKKAIRIQLEPNRIEYILKN